MPSQIQHRPSRTTVMVEAALHLNMSTDSCRAIHFLIGFLAAGHLTGQITRHSCACRNPPPPYITAFLGIMMDNGVMSYLALSLSPDPFVAVYSLHQTISPRFPTLLPVSGTRLGVKTRHAPHAKQHPDASTSSAYVPDVVPCLAVSWGCRCLDL